MGAKNANAKGSKFRDRSHCDCVHLLNTGIEVDHRLCSSTVCVCGGGSLGVCLWFREFVFPQLGEGKRCDQRALAPCEPSLHLTSAKFSPCLSQH